MSSHADPIGTNRDWLADALTVANVPTLACILVHLTGDRRWIEPPFTPSRVRGMEDNDSGGLSDALQDEIRTAALAACEAWFNGVPPALPDPDDAMLMDMMRVSLGEEIPAAYAAMVRQDLGLGPKLAAPTRLPEGFNAIIIGAGISGLCAAIELAKANIPYIIVERRQDLGGVWFDNRYPGAACDVPSHLYSFSFAPYEWSRFFAGSREIHHYLEQVAETFAVRGHIRFGVEVTEARYNEHANQWQVDVESVSGGKETLCARMVVGMGQGCAATEFVKRCEDAGFDARSSGIPRAGNPRLRGIAMPDACLMAHARTTNRTITSPHHGTCRRPRRPRTTRLHPTRCNRRRAALPRSAGPARAQACGWP